MKKKYIFYIDSMQKGGANRVIANLTDFFVKEGMHVILINDITPSKMIPEYEVNKLIERVYLNNKNTFRILSNIKRIFELRKIIKKEKADVVVSFMGPPNLRMIIATTGLKCKKVISVRNDPNIEYGSGLIKYLKCKILNLADGCVFQTEEAAKYFPVTLQKKSRIIFNPVSEDFYKIRRSQESKDIVAVGRLESQKNPFLLIEAFSNIAMKFPNENLIFYGEGSLRKDMETLIIRLNLVDRVLMPGSTSDISDKLSKAKIFILSSDYEGMPNALMEAMAAGVPAISTDCPCGGPKSLIENSKQGILVPIKNVEAMSKAMYKLLSNPQNLLKMSIETKKRAKIFTPEKVFSQWNEYLNSI